MIRSDSGYIRNINGIFVAIASVIFVLAVWQIRGILMLASAAVMLTIGISIPVRWLIKRGLSRGLAIVMAILGGFVLLVALSLLVFPALFSQFSQLATDIIPRGIEQLIARWNSGEFFEAFPFLEEFSDDFTSSFRIDSQLVQQVITQASTALGQLSESVLPLIGGVLSGVLSVLIIFFLCMYLLADPERYVQGIIRLTPLWYRDRMRQILARLDSTIRAWIGVTVLSMLVAGVGTSLGLALIGVRQWAALGVLAGVSSFIPNFGPLIALVPSIAVAIIESPQNVLWVIVIIYGVSFIQSQVVGPILANESMRVPPVMILVGQIVFGVFFGFWGIMLAVPFTAVVLGLVEEIYVRDVLGDRPLPQPVTGDDHHLMPEVD